MKKQVCSLSATKQSMFYVFMLINICACFCQENKTAITKITSSKRQVNECFGWACGIYNNYCVVGTPGTMGYSNNSRTKGALAQEVGSISIFKNTGENNWQFKQKIVSDNSKACDFFGDAVGINEKFIVVGAKGEDSSIEPDHLIRNGAVYIYTLDKDGIWIKHQKLVLAQSNPNDNFGFKVSINNSNLVASAPVKINQTTQSQGAVFVYQLNNQNLWALAQEINSPNKDVYMFGKEIAQSDSILIISGQASKMVYVYVYKLNNNGTYTLLTTISQVQKKNNEDMITSLAVLKNFILIGSAGEYDHNDNLKDDDTLVLANREKKKLGAGLVSVYEIKANKAGVLKQTLVAKDSKADAHFGNSMAISDSLLIIGAFGDKLENKQLKDNRYGGAAYIFIQKNNQWVQDKKICSHLVLVCNEDVLKKRL